MNKLKTFRKFAAVCGGVISMTAVLSASTITFDTPSGSLSGTESVDATATFVTGPGVLTVTLQSLTSNIQDASQLLSDLQFTLSSGGTATLASSSGQEVTVDKNGVPTTGSTVSTGWGFGTNSGGFILCDVCPGSVTFQTLATTTPSHTIITTQSSYSANGSIEGNSAHNPFLNGIATFTIDDSAITTNTVVDSAIFSFSTAAGVDVTGVPPTDSVPEPSSLMLLGSGLFGFGLLSRRLRKQS